MRLEIMLHKVRDRKDTFFDYKNKNFLNIKNRFFPKSLAHGFGPKMQIFFIVFGQKKE